MSLSAKLRRAPVRIVTGAFILNSGHRQARRRRRGRQDDPRDGRRGVPDSREGPAHAVRQSGRRFRGRARESRCCCPIVPAGLAGLGLIGFSGSLLGMYWRTPGMHEEGSIRPTQQGTAIAKDVWMLGIGAALVARRGARPRAQQEGRADPWREGGHRTAGGQGDLVGEARPGQGRDQGREGGAQGVQAGAGRAQRITQGLRQGHPLIVRTNESGPSPIGSGLIDH